MGIVLSGDEIGMGADAAMLIVPSRVGMLKQMLWLRVAPDSES